MAPLRFSFRYLGALLELRWLGQERRGLDVLTVLDRDHALRVLRVLGEREPAAKLRDVLRAAPHRDGERPSDAELLVALADDLARGHLLLCRAGEEQPSGGDGDGKPQTVPPPTVPPPQTKPPPYDIEVSYVSYIAAGAENPKPNVRWKIEDPGTAIDSGVLEVFRSHSDNDDTPIFRRDLTKPELDKGPHEWPWDGAIGAHGEMPQGHCSVEFSPYKIRITVRGSGHEPKSDDAEFEVVATRIELAFGTDEMIGEVDRAVMQLVKEEAASITDKLIRVPLRSNLFTLNGLDNYVAANSYGAYVWLWGIGPRIPIVASVWIRNQHGFESLAPKAWGRRKLLFSVELFGVNGLIQAPAVTFMRTSADYLVSKTIPLGDTCHVDRGGKRSPQGVGHFLLVNEPDFPVTDLAVHRQGALMGSREDGEFTGKTAINLVPGPQAGDAYQVVARFDPRVELDAPYPQTELVARSGVVVTKRRVTIVKLMKKLAAVPEIAPGTLADSGPFVEAALHFEVPNPSYEVVDEATYNTLVAAAVAADPVAQAIVDPTANQALDGPWLITFRPWSAMGAILAAWPTTDPIRLKLWLAERDENAYIDLCRFTAAAIGKKVVPAFASSESGVTLFLTDGITNHDDRQQELVDQARPGGPRLKEAGETYPLGNIFRGMAWLASTAERTLWHELGHVLCMPHAPALVATEQGPVPATWLHDMDTRHCIMNYDMNDKQFCGFCNLRLRGWNGSTLKPNAASNRVV
jgi:hypothetical protein